MTTPKTEIRFRRGIDPVTEIPEEARANGLTERIAIIQESYRPDKVDMFFDEALFLRLLDYARKVSDGGTVEVIEEALATRQKTLLSKMLGRDDRTQEVRTLDDFLQGWSATPSDEKEPPIKVLVLKCGSPNLCIATEFWTRVGGPPEYHDSYTYSIFSREDRSEEIREFLAASPEADSWSFAAAA